MERIINAFESGWQAGAFLGGARLAHFASVGTDLQTFWLDGSYSAQADIGNSDAVTYAIDINQFDPEQPIALVAGEHRISHPITRALHAAYRAAGGPPSQDSLAAMLAKLDLIP
jgi:hypothetical protein